MKNRFLKFENKSGYNSYKVVQEIKNPNQTLFSKDFD